LDEPPFDTHPSKRPLESIHLGECGGIGCCTPWHIALGTVKENVKRRVRAQHCFHQLDGQEAKHWKYTDDPL
jgi:hypothetical protein